ncbi:uncharacterized protein LOC144105130 [Amblyomma americanum]
MATILKKEDIRARCICREREECTSCETSLNALFRPPLSRKESGCRGSLSLFFVRAASARVCVLFLRHFAFLCATRWKAAKTQSRNVWAAAENQLQRVEHAVEGGLEGLPTTPHLAVIGSSMGDIKKIIVAVDSTRSLEKAMGLLLGAFFVFNVAYPPDCPLTMEFLQRYLGQSNPTKGRGKGRACGIAPKLLSLLNAL